MKAVVTFVIPIFMFISSFSQQEINSKLYYKFDAEHLNRLQENDPQSIAYLNFSAEYSYKIIETFPSEKINYLPILFKLDKSKKTADSSTNFIVDKNNFNLFEYYFERDQNKRKYFRIGNSDLVLELFSEKETIEAYNQLYNK
jgi:hypothetical protein